MGMALSDLCLVKVPPGFYVSVYTRFRLNVRDSLVRLMLLVRVNVFLGLRLDPLPALPGFEFAMTKATLSGRRLDLFRSCCYC